MSCRRWRACGRRGGGTWCCPTTSRSSGRSRALGLGELVESVVCSALIGYEKPHPRAFEIALERCDASPVWMVGDNADADVRGAEAVGVPAIQVRRAPAEGVRLHAPDLPGAAEIIRRS